jgi:protein SCO1/2
MIRRLAAHAAVSAVLVASLLGHAYPALASEGGADEHAAALDQEVALARSQAAVGSLVGNRRFVDERGNAIGLADFKGRPVIVNLIYTACAGACPIVTDRLADAVDVARDALGDGRFAVVTVGFDVDGDKPRRLAAYRRAHGITDADWHFLSGDQTAIDGLMDDLGFSRVASARGFDHIAQTSILDADGRVRQQVYGVDFEPPALVDPLKAILFAEAGKLAAFSDIVDRVRLFCTFYDSRAGRYAFDYSFFISFVVGGLVLLGLGVILVRAYFGGRRRAQKPA